MLSTSLLLAASMVVGQAPVSNYEHLKSFDALIGCWSLDGEILEDVPDEAEKGTKMTAHTCHRWILKKNAIEIRGVVKTGDLEENEFVTIIGWNRNTNTIFQRSQSSRGSVGEGEITVSPDGKTWTHKIENITPEGKIVTSTVIKTLADPNTLVWQATDRAGGDLTGDSPKYTLTRCTCDDDDDEDDDDEDD